MHVVIDISEQDYKLAHDYPDVLFGSFGRAIANGTVLPKGHGDLIDVNDLLDRIGLEDNESNREENVGEIVTLEDFDYIPTIIPADTEGSEEE